MERTDLNTGLYQPDREHSSCGVGFLTRKDGLQTHELMKLGHEALCAVPHRGGMSSEGVGDGELPHMAFTEYLLEAPRPTSPAHQAGRGMVVHCMDISGSLRITTKLPDIQGRLSQMYSFQLHHLLFLCFRHFFHVLGQN